MGVREHRARKEAVEDGSVYNKGNTITHSSTHSSTHSFIHSLIHFLLSEGLILSTSEENAF